jgi:transposase-like protein
MGRKSSQSVESVWRDRLAKFGTSNLTVRQFCRQEGVSDPSFYRWRKLLEAGQPGAKRVRRSSLVPSKTVASPPFVPVSVPASISVATSIVAEVELPSGVRIRVPAMQSEALRVAILTGNEACREVR